MLKLFRIELKQSPNSETLLPKNCSPMITYVVAPTMDSAHIALLNAYKDDIANGDISESDINIDTLTVIASEDNQIFQSNFYRLVDYRNINDKENDNNE